MIKPYGSLRLQVESVSVDQAIEGEDDSYTGLRDAYSRVGIKATGNIKDGASWGAVVELPINLPELNIEDPTFFEGFYKSNRGPRLYNISASNREYGSLKYGKQWLAYYNYIAYPVDYFSSFFAGFATDARFRREALTYSSPDFSGFTATISGIDLTHGEGTSYLDTMQYAASYKVGSFTVAIAYQDTHDDLANLLGVSAAYTTGPWRFATKIEQLYSNDSVTQNVDPVTYNLYASYTMDKFVFKGMFANGDGEPGNNDEPSTFLIGHTYHFGIDYQYKDNLMFFTEYFYEQSGYAIYTPDSVAFTPLSGYQDESNGHAIAIGVRFDF